MNSVERYWEYQQIAQEHQDPAPGFNKPDGWPQKGAIEFKDFTFKYRSVCFFSA